MYFNMFCPNCGRRLVDLTEGSGVKIVCPVCGVMISARTSEDRIELSVSQLDNNKGRKLREMRNA